MLGIRKRMALSFIFIIILTVLVLEAMIITIVRQSYDRNLEEILYSQVRVSCDLYEKYFSDASLYDNVLNNVDSFWQQTDAEVQIIDSTGKVLMDSIGILPGPGAKLPDVEEALKTGRGSWTGKVPYDSEGVVAVSSPLISNGKNVGVLRFITSLKVVNGEVAALSRIFIVIGLLVAAAAALISLVLSNTIVGPLKEITNAAEKMASGMFTVRSRKKYNDEVGKLSDTLNYMADELQKRDRLKNDFISSVSHELRTPLTSIKGWAVTLMEGNPEERELLQDGLSIIEKESDRLTSMVEELLDFSRFVTGKVTVTKNRTNLGNVVNQVYKQLIPRAELEGLAFNLKVETELPCMMTDENRLKQVFINILDNSFKFTPPGGTVDFSAGCTDDSAVFVIRDTGSGIAEEDLPQIKDKFFKGRNSKSGNGIGLSICDEIIRHMGGSFEISSQPGTGTVNVITLPFDA